jgi:hypothetical protein
MTSTNTYTHSNHYLTLVCNIALKNKYTRWYFNIISRALERPRNRKGAKALFGYVEGHHILPKSFELEGQKDRNNIAFLTPREHFIIHAILTKMFEGVYRYKMIHAFVIIKVGNQYNKSERYFNSRLYDYHRKYFAERASNDKKHLEKMWAAAQAAIKSKPRCPSHNKKIADSLRGHIVTEETRKKLSLAHTGRKASEECKKKKSETMKSKDLYNSRKIKQFDLNGTFIKEWRTISEATRYYNNSGIIHCLTGNNKTSAGFIWKYS